MATLTLSITIPAGTAPDQHAERGVLTSMLATAINDIGGTRKTSGTMAWDQAQMGTWTYTPVASE